MACCPSRYAQLRVVSSLIGVVLADAYGLEKLYAEEICKHYGNDFGFEARIARFHNIYGPQGTWRGGREKAPGTVAQALVHSCFLLL